MRCPACDRNLARMPGPEMQAHLAAHYDATPVTVSAHDGGRLYEVHHRDGVGLADR